MTERTPLLASLEEGEDTIFDPSTEVAGFVASQLEHQLEHHKAHQHHQHDPHPEELEISDTKKNVILVSMYLGVFLASLDGTIVTTLIGHIASEFNSLPKLSWIATSYLVSSATFQPLYGKLSDIFGRRALLIFSNVLFTIGCTLCWLAPNVNILIFGRFISGAGGGGLTSLSSITTSDLVPLKSRGIYQGITNVAFALGTAIGGLLGGLCSDTLGWRFAFLIQVPIALLSCLAIYLFLNLPKKHDEDEVDIIAKLKMIDWFGSLSLVIFLLLFLTGASFGGKEIPFDSIQFISISIIATIFLLLFIYLELKVSPIPIIPLQFLKIPTVIGVSLSNFFSSVSTFTSYFIIPIYFTAIMNLNSTEIGQRFSPNFFSIIIGSLGAGIYIRSTGKYRTLLLLSGLIAVFGVYRIVKLNPSYSIFEQYILMVTPGMGFSVIITATLLALIAAVPHEHQAATTSISYLFRSTGSTLGVSIGSAIFTNKLEKELSLNVLKFKDQYDLEVLTDIIYKAKHSSEYVHHGAPDFVIGELMNSYDHAAKLAFKFCFVATILSFLSLLLIKEYVLHSTLKRK